MPPFNVTKSLCGCSMIHIYLLAVKRTFSDELCFVFYLTFEIGLTSGLVSRTICSVIVMRKTHRWAIYYMINPCEIVEVVRATQTTNAVIGILVVKST